MIRWFGTVQQLGIVAIVTALLVIAGLVIGYFSVTLVASIAATNSLAPAPGALSQAEGSLALRLTPIPQEDLPTISGDQLPPATATVSAPPTNASITNKITLVATVSAATPAAQITQNAAPISATATLPTENPTVDSTQPVVADQQVPVPTVPRAPNRAPMPLSLKIAALAVDAPIVPVGLDAKGFMAAPSKAEIAGWYNLGPRPGEPSNAIIAGHVDWMGKEGVFSQLHTLQAGDIIEVNSETTLNFRYVVTSIQIYQNDTAPVAEIFGGTSEAILTLITCTGPYDARAAEYRDRLVIRAKMIPD